MWSLIRLLRRHWDLHIVEAIRLNRIVVKPRAIAGLPLETADHTELCHTAAVEC
jgi:hypothetical protein